MRSTVCRLKMDELDELRAAVRDMAAENERLSDRLAVEAIDASEEERTSAARVMAELRATIAALRAEVAALKSARNMLMADNAGLRRSLTRKRYG